MLKTNIIKASGKIGRIIIMRIAPGCDLLRSIKEVAEEEKIKSGIIIGGAASLRNVSLRNPRGFIKKFPITDKSRIFTKLEGPLELLSISGNIAHEEEGRLVVHAHVVVSTGCPESITYGGHLVEGAIIYTTGELVIAEVEGIDLKRVVNEETLNPELVPVKKRTK